MWCWVIPLKKKNVCLKHINKKFLLPLNIDFGIPSIRQSINYFKEAEGIFYWGKEINYDEDGEYFVDCDIEHSEFLEIINIIIIQKILPRFIFDGNDSTLEEKNKNAIVNEFSEYLKTQLRSYNFDPRDSYGAPYNDPEERVIENNAYDLVSKMIKQSNNKNSQFNFFA